MPFSLGQEKLINPFLRADDKILMDSLGLNIDNPEIFFKEIRNQKDNF
ncbi:hydroxyacylglutathione hydrolase C-terminal domain-containing protein [Alphaproteobacteria bacterium]|nr:hydroxyacylglutathione hydrolase C-terminal domain-containing protein [Alphaproteobacteria bacterium]